jgi:iron complex outermembrane recepter protein
MADTKTSSIKSQLNNKHPAHQEILLQIHVKYLVSVNLLPENIMKKIPATSLFFLIIFLVCLLSAPDLSAQYGSVTGTVTDNNNRPLPGATVQMEGTMFGTVAETDGSFILSDVPAGQGVLVVRYIGYTTFRYRIRVEEDQTIEINAILAPDPLGLGEVVVSGTFNPATQLESSTAITTLNPAQIDRRIPRGPADLLKAVPGVQVTSNYGEAGADVTVRGLPLTANSSFRYISLQEDGLPVFEPPGLLFAFPDAMVRQDETVARVEAVRGGSAAVFASNTPGGIVNFISKTGGEELSGSIKSSAGLHGMIRQDVNIGGPLSEHWRFNTGGYYRYDEGVRSPGYPANLGGQLKLNLTRYMENGYFRFYAKYLNERNAWYMGGPIQNYRNPEPISGGPEIGSGTTFSPERRTVTIPDAYNPGEFTRRSLEDLYHTRYHMAGLELSRDLDSGWNLTARSRLMHARNDNNLMIDVADPFPVTAFGQPNLPAEVPRFIRFVNSGEIITDQQQVANLNNNGLISVHGMAFSEQPVTNFITSVQVNREIGKHNLNAGIYFSTYRTAFRLVQNGVFVEVANQPRMVQVMIPDQDGEPMGLTPPDGFAGYNSGFWNLRSFTNLGALYLGDTWTVSDRLQIDGGLRMDINFSRGNNERPVNPGQVVNGEVVGQVTPDGYSSFTPTPEQSRNGLFGSGIYRTWDYNFTTISGSVGINYKLSDRFALYARGSRGNRAPEVRQWTFQASDGSQITGETVRGEIESILQAESGVKVQSSGWSLLLTGFYSASKNLITTLHRGQADGSFIFLPITGDTRTFGVEIEAALQPVNRLDLRLNSTIQDPRFTRFEYDFFVPGDNPESGLHQRDYSGNYLNEAVKFMADLTAAYAIGPADLFINYRYTGERMANRPNTIEIPAYSEFMAGAGVAIRNLYFAVQGTNLFNTQAIAQMASRTGEDVLRVNPDGSADVLVTSGPSAGTTMNTSYTTGLGILPRSLMISATYRF